jgi:DNA-directed RNA polymerase subunit RPC12/RpoP
MIERCKGYQAGLRRSAAWNEAEDSEEYTVSDVAGVEAQHEFPCANCGASVGFKPGARALQCPYCTHKTAIPQRETDVLETDFRAALTRQRKEHAPETVRIVDCSACGAKTEAPPTQSSFDCPYCGSPIVSAVRTANRIQPDYLLPFEVPRDAADSAFKDWIKGLWFAPSALSARARVTESLNGIYVPYWTYDATTVSFYRGERGTNYTVTETYTENGETKRRQVVKVRWADVTGVIQASFDDVLVMATDVLPRRYSERLEPWDLHALETFQPALVSGFRTEVYSTGLEAGFDDAREKMDEQIKRLVRRDIGGDHQRVHAIKTDYRDVSFKHILLPVWIATYRYADKPYRFLVNARTAEVQGERPYSVVKIALAVVAAIAVIAGVVWLNQ